MKKSRYTEEQIAYCLRLAESGTPVANVCRQMGIAEATFYICKKKFASLGVPELRQMRQMQEENARLTRHRIHIEGAGCVGLSPRRTARLHASWKAHRQWALRVIQRSPT